MNINMKLIENFAVYRYTKGLVSVTTVAAILFILFVLTPESFPPCSLFLLKN